MNVLNQLVEEEVLDEFLSNVSQLRNVRVLEYTSVTENQFLLRSKMFILPCQPTCFLSRCWAELCFLLQYFFQLFRILPAVPDGQNFNVVF